MSESAAALNPPQKPGETYEAYIERVVKETNAAFEVVKKAHAEMGAITAGDSANTRRLKAALDALIGLGRLVEIQSAELDAQFDRVIATLQAHQEAIRSLVERANKTEEPKSPIITLDQL